MELATPPANLHVRDVALNPDHPHYSDFAAYLRGLCSDEHLDFLRDVSEYCKLVRAATPTDALFPVAKRICDVYLTQGTTREINIDNTTRCDTVASVQARRLEIDTFDGATDKVIKMLSAPDCFPKFMANLRRAQAAGSGTLSKSTSSATLQYLSEGRGNTMPRTVHKSQSTGALDPKLAGRLNENQRKRRETPPHLVGSKSPTTSHANPGGSAFISFTMDFEADAKPHREEHRRSITRSLLSLRATFMSTSQTSIGTTQSNLSNTYAGQDREGSILDASIRGMQADGHRTPTRPHTPTGHDQRTGYFHFEPAVPLVPGGDAKRMAQRRATDGGGTRFQRPTSNVAWRDTQSTSTHDEGGLDAEMSLLDFLNDEPTTPTTLLTPFTPNPGLARQLSSGSLRSLSRPPTPQSPGMGPDHAPALRMSMQNIEDLIRRRRNELLNKRPGSRSPSPGPPTPTQPLKKSTSVPSLPSAPELSLLEFLTEGPSAPTPATVAAAKTAPNTPEGKTARRRRESQIKMMHMSRLSITEETDKEMSFLDFLNDEPPASPTIPIEPEHTGHRSSTTSILASLRVRRSTPRVAAG